jgi:hypothetical protein
MIASTLLVFTHDVQYVRVGLVAALWAAAVSALAMTKYRRELVAEYAKARDLLTVYQLQLEREVTARREYELGVGSRIRKNPRWDTEEMAGLHAELATLRKYLELWFGGELPPPRRDTDATAIVELPGSEARNGGPRNGLPRPPAAHGRCGEAPTAMFTTSVIAAGPAFASPCDEPVTAQPSSVSRLPLAGDTEPSQWPVTVDQWQTMPHHGWSDADWESDELDDGSHSQGLSVAQIMANLRLEGGRLPAPQRGHRRDY